MAFEDGVFATFFDDALENKAAGRKAGYPVFDEVLMIKIQIPNQHDCVPRPATDADKKRFPNSWQAYVSGKEPAETGFPIDQWPRITKATLMYMEANQIKTVEQLAAVPDSSLHRLGPGGMGLKMEAQKFLNKRDEVSELRKELAAMKQQLASQQQEIKQDEPTKRQPKVYEIK